MLFGIGQVVENLLIALAHGEPSLHQIGKIGRLVTIDDAIRRIGIVEPATEEPHQIQVHETTKTTCLGYQLFLCLRRRKQGVVERRNAGDGCIGRIDARVNVLPHGRAVIIGRVTLPIGHQIKGIVPVVPQSGLSAQHKRLQIAAQIGSAFICGIDPIYYVLCRLVISDNIVENLFVLGILGQEIIARSSNKRKSYNK